MNCKIEYLGRYLFTLKRSRFMSYECLPYGNVIINIFLLFVTINMSTSTILKVEYLILTLKYCSIIQAFLKIKNKCNSIGRYIRNFLINIFEFLVDFGIR